MARDLAGNDSIREGGKEGGKTGMGGCGRTTPADGRTPCGAHLTREMGTSNVESLEPRSVGHCLTDGMEYASMSFSLPRHDKATATKNELRKLVDVSK